MHTSNLPWCIFYQILQLHVLCRQSKFLVILQALILVHAIIHTKDFLSECTVWVIIKRRAFSQILRTFQYSLEIWRHVLVAIAIFSITALRILTLTLDPINLVIGWVIYIPFFSSLKNTCISDSWEKKTLVADT